MKGMIGYLFICILLQQRNATTAEFSFRWVEEGKEEHWTTIMRRDTSGMYYADHVIVKEFIKINWIEENNLNFLFKIKFLTML
jgi:hypothetical protein